MNIRDSLRIGIREHHPPAAFPERFSPSTQRFSSAALVNSAISSEKLARCLTINSPASSNEKVLADLPIGASWSYQQNLSIPRYFFLALAYSIIFSLHPATPSHIACRVASFILPLRSGSA